MAERLKVALALLAGEMGMVLALFTSYGGHYLAADVMAIIFTLIFLWGMRKIINNL